MAEATAADQVRAATARITKWLAAHEQAKDALASFRKPAAEKAIADFEAKAKLRLPDGVRALYLLHDGQDEDAANEGRDESIESGLFPSLEPGDLAFLLIPLKQLKQNTPTTKRASRMPGYRLNWVGIGDNYGGDNIVIDLNTDNPAKRGRVLQFNHEYGGAVELAQSIEAYLTALADDLEAGRVVFDEESGLSYAEGRDWDDLIDEGKVEYDPEMEGA